MSLKVDRVQLEIEIKNDSSRKRLRELEDQINGMRKSMKNMKDSSPEYAKQQKELHALVKEYDGIINKIGITNLSLTELRKRQKDLNSILRNMPPTNENYGAYKDEIAKVNARIKELRPNAKSVSESLSKFGTSFQVFAGNMMTKAFDTIQQKIRAVMDDIKQFVGESILVASKAEGIVTAFNKLGDTNLLEKLRSETKGLVSDFQLMQSAVKAQNFGIPIQKLDILLKFAQQRAQETGESVDYLVDSIITGLGRKSVLILDNLQIKQEEIKKRTASGGDFITSVIDLINEKLEEQGDLALTAADKEQLANIKRENAQLKVGKGLLGISNLWNKMSGSFYETIGNLAEKYIPSLVRRIEDISNKFIDWYNSSTLLRNQVSMLYLVFGSFFNLSKRDLKNILDLFGAFADIGKSLFDLDFEGAKKGYQDFLKNVKKNQDVFVKDTTETILNARSILNGSINKIDITPGNISTPLNKKTIVDNTTPKSDKSAAQRTKLNNELKKIEEDHLKEMAAIQKKYLSGEIETEFDFNQAILSQQDQFDAKRKEKLQELSKTLTDPSVRIDILKQIADIDKKMLDRQVDQANKIKKIILASDPITSEKEAHNNRLREVGLFGKKREDLSKEQLSALEQLEKQHADNMQKLSSKEAIIALKELDLNQSESIKHLEERRISEKMGEQQYRDELLKIEIDYLNKRLRINGLSSEKIAEINKQINKVTAEGISNKGQARETVINKFNIKSLKDQKEEELSVIKYYEDQKIITEDEALKIRKQINDQYLAASIESFSKANDAIQQVGGNLTGAMTNFQSAEEDAISRKYDKQIKAAEGNSKLQKKLEAKKEEEVNKIRAKYADKQFAVQTAQIISETSLAAMRAYSALAGIPVVGPALGAAAAAAAITYGASQIKVAKEQRDAAKEGYQSGGFTSSSSRDDKEAGVVHTNEFVANANAVRNPSVRKFLDVFDMAQKNGSIHMLNTTQILEKVRSETNRGYQSGGYTPSTDSSRNIEKTLISIIENNTNAMDRMVTQIDNGIEAYSVISGENGSYRQTQKYESYIKRASRQSR